MSKLIHVTNNKKPRTKVQGIHYKKRKHKRALKGEVIFFCNITKLSSNNKNRP